MNKRLVATFVLELLMVGVASVSQATDLTANVTVDDAFEMYVSTDDCQLGTPVCSSVAWQTATPCTSTLTPGVKNYIHVVGRDLYTVIAGFLGDFTLSNADFTFSNGLQSLLTNETAGWDVYTDNLCGTKGVLTNQGANGVDPWGDIALIDPAASWIWTDGGDYSEAPRYFSATITPTDDDVVESVPMTGIITTRNGELGNDQAQFKLKEMASVQAAATEAIANGINMTLKLGSGKECDNPIVLLDVPSSDLKLTYLNLRYTVGNLDVLRCVHNSGDCVINIKKEELKSLISTDGKTLDDLLTGQMTVCLKVGETTYSNGGVWTQYDSGSGSWTKYRKDVPADMN
ncbi:hypothetical protein [Candidatus Electronema sp. PJ]|uniref:hypothetical protein n=1 Tax=Candidatus Electronema sp. PJ TaxID=3401572 RepID=UPI003AA86530